jgi:hypothetical protein
MAKIRQMYFRQKVPPRDCEAYGPVLKHGSQLAAADRYRRAQVSQARQSKRRRLMGVKLSGVGYLRS